MLSSVLFLAPFFASRNNRFFSSAIRLRRLRPLVAFLLLVRCRGLRFPFTLLSDLQRHKFPQDRALCTDGVRLRSNQAAHILPLWRKQIVRIARVAAGKSLNGTRKVHARFPQISPAHPHRANRNWFGPFHAIALPAIVRSALWQGRAFRSVIGIATSKTMKRTTTLRTYRLNRLLFSIAV